MKENYLYTWTCAHSGKKYQTHFYTLKEHEEELNRQLKCLNWKIDDVGIFNKALQELRDERINKKQT